MLTVNTELFWILVGVTVAVLMQAFVLLGMLLIMRKAFETAKERADEYRGKIMPLLETGTQLVATGKDLVTSTRSLIDALKPELEGAAAELTNMTQDIRGQVNRLQASVDEVAQKARHQADRVDSMTTSFLNGLDRVGAFMNEAVHAPIRQVNGFVAAARAVVDSLRSPGAARSHAARPQPTVPRGRPAPQVVSMEDDKDLFI